VIRFFSRNRWRTLYVVCLSVVVAGRAGAQYYDRPTDGPFSSRFAYFGINGVDFAPRSSNTAADSLAIRFTRIMPLIGFRQGLVDILFGYTRFDQHGTSLPAIFLGTTVATEFLLTGRAGNALLLPLLLAADFTRADAGGLERDNFNVGSIGIGAGLRYRTQAEAVQFSIGVVQLVQFSFEGYSTTAGSSLATIGEAVLHWNNVVVADGVVLGYRFRYQTWSMKNAASDYRSLSHGPFLGVMF
jgi:hypothetical protein